MSLPSLLEVARYEHELDHGYPIELRCLNPGCGETWTTLAREGEVANPYCPGCESGKHEEVG